MIIDNKKNVLAILSNIITIITEKIYYSHDILKMLNTTLHDGKINTHNFSSWPSWGKIASKAKMANSKLHKRNSITKKQ